MSVRRVVVYYKRGQLLNDAADASGYCPYCRSSSGHSGGCINMPSEVIDVETLTDFQLDHTRIYQQGTGAIITLREALASDHS